MVSRILETLLNSDKSVHYLLIMEGSMLQRRCSSSLALPLCQHIFHDGSNEDITNENVSHVVFYRMAILFTCKSYT